MAALQPQLQEKVDDLCDGIRDHLQKNTVVDLRPAFLALTIDVIFTYGMIMHAKDTAEADSGTRKVSDIYNLQHSACL